MPIKRRKKIPIKKVVLPVDAIVHVVVPKGVIPVVAADRHKGIVEIVPIKQDKKKVTWWESLFGVETIKS